MDESKDKRGRPLGYKLSNSTKNKIRLKRVGTHHSQVTRDKISVSLTAYFKRRGLLADIIEQEYAVISKEAVKWIHDNHSNINNFGSSVMSEKRLTTLSQIELLMGNEIEYLFGHNATPEFLMMIKEELQLSKNTELLKELDSLV